MDKKDKNNEKPPEPDLEIETKICNTINEEEED